MTSNVATTKAYSATLPDGKVKGFNSLTVAREYAEGFSQEEGKELEVVHTSTGAVAFVSTPVQGRIFYPFERVETPTFRAPHIEGFRPAYTRKRIEATVYRALDESSWLVHDGRTGGRVVLATTRQACITTREMRLGRRLDATHSQAEALAALGL